MQKEPNNMLEAQQFKKNTIQLLIPPIAIILIAGGGFLLAKQSLSRRAELPASLTKPAGGEQQQQKTIIMRTRAGEWRFEPKTIELNKGDRVMLKIYNEDDYDHGIAIEALAINKRLPPKTETVIEFIADKEGRMPFYCSIPCGEGHFHMTGAFIVK